MVFEGIGLRDILGLQWIGSTLGIRSRQGEWARSDWGSL
jgi:hypothetical protein